ncbi:MAG: 2-C-methyl-D-erythritol 4-phosphate cytidylyltransferase [Actinomycetes bacterium]
MVAVVITAAGAGDRLGPGAPKAHRLLDGKPLFVYSLRTFAGVADIDHIIVVARADEVANVQETIASVKSLESSLLNIDVVAGGATRQESVARGLAALTAEDDLVLIHDAARALVPVDVVRSVIARLVAGEQAVIPVVPVTDTMRAFTDGNLGPVVDRAGLVAVQTPQGFTKDIVVRAHQDFDAGSGVAATDDASLVELLGVSVTYVDGSPDAFKVTYANDLLLAESVIADRKGVQA